MLYSGLQIVQDERLSKRNHGVIMRMVSQLLGLSHLHDDIPKHFQGGPETTPGSGGYRFSPRSRKYLDWKRRHAPGKPLLVLTGRLMAAAMAGTITATQYKWTYRATSPHAIENMRRKAQGLKPFAKNQGPMLPDWLRSEVEVMSPAEIREKCLMAERAYARLANKPFYQLKRRVVLRG